MFNSKGKTYQSKTMVDLRNIPSVDKLLRSDGISRLISAYGRPLTLEAVRASLEEIREATLAKAAIPPAEEIILDVESRLEAWLSPTLKPPGRRPAGGVKNGDPEEALQGPHPFI